MHVSNQAPFRVEYTVGKIGHKRGTLAKVKELPVREFHPGIGRPFKGNKAGGEWAREW